MTNILSFDRVPWASSIYELYIFFIWLKLLSREQALTFYPHFLLFIIFQFT